MEAVLTEASVVQCPDQGKVTFTPVPGTKLTVAGSRVLALSSVNAVTCPNTNAPCGPNLASPLPATTKLTVGKEGILLPTPSTTMGVTKVTSNQSKLTAV